MTIAVVRISDTYREYVAILPTFGFVRSSTKDTVAYPTITASSVVVTGLLRSLM